MIRLMFLGLIRAYQILISPLFPQACRFTPSCSSYAYDAIEKYGLPRGAYLRPGSGKILSESKEIGLVEIY
jgi:putative membrane protein insertion efficiency factor